MRSEYRLEQLCAVIADCPHSTPKWTEHGVVVLRNQYIKNGRLNLTNPSFTDEENFAYRIRRAKPQHKDIVLTREAPIGELCQIPLGLKCCLGQRQVLIRPDTRKVDADYLFYALRSPKVQHEMLLSEGSGSTVSNLRIPLIEALKISLPSVGEQIKVGAFLKSLEDLIDAIEQQNTTFEAIAQTLFRSWFVNFDPVHAKVAGQTPEGMSPELAALFPSEFVESKLGVIPRGWNVLSANEVCSISIGKTPPRKEPQWFSTNSDDVKWLSIRDMGNSGLVICDTSEYLPSEGVKKFGVKVAPARTPFYSFKLTVGRVGISDEPMATNEAIAHFVCDKDKVDYPFVLCRLIEQGKESVDSTSSIGIATNSKLLKELPFLVPSRNLMSAFSAATLPIYEMIFANSRVIKSLCSLRDELLPRLISGKLRIEEAEEAVSEVLGSAAEEEKAA